MVAVATNIGAALETTGATVGLRQAIRAAPVHQENDATAASWAKLSFQKEKSLSEDFSSLGKTDVTPPFSQKKCIVYVSKTYSPL